MLLLLIYFLKAWGVRVPAVFEYTSTRMALAAITALLVTLLYGKFFIRKLYEWKIGDRVRVEDCPLLGQLHRNKNETPTMGGILILFSLFFSLFLWMDWRSIFTQILAATTVVIGALGGIDDYLKLRYKNKKGLSSRQKMGVQVIFSGLVALFLLLPNINFLSHQAFTTLYIPFYKYPLIQFHGLGLVLLFLFMIFVITGSSNAVNLTDGLDGLATGSVFIVASAFSLIAFISSHVGLANYLHILYIPSAGEIAIFLSAMMGATLGFLWYNAHPAQVFMGDTGSLTLGALLGVVAVLLRREFLLAIIGGIFVLEALSVIIQVSSFRLRKKRIFLCSPLHHHFEYKGWPETKIVIRFWIVGLLFALIGLATLKFQ